MAEVIAGAASTVRVKDWVAVLAHSVAGGDGDRVGPAGPRAGVPARVAVPLPLSTKVTPVGRVPVSPSEAVGVAGRGHREDPAVPVVKVAWLAEVIAGAASTVRVKDWVARATHTVAGGDGDRVGPPRPPWYRPGWRCRCRCRRRSPRVGRVPDSPSEAVGVAGRGHRERSGGAGGEGGVVGRGDRRGGVDGQGEGLVGRTSPRRCSR